MKAILLAVGIMFIIAGMSYAFELENVMAMWLLDEDGGDVAGDSSGNGNDGELNNGPEWIEGVFGSALEFDGSNNVIIQDAPTLDTELNDGFTFVCWQRMDAANADGCYIDKAEGWENKMSYYIYCSHGAAFGFLVVSQDGTMGLCNDFGTPIIDTWQHVAGVYDGSDMMFYVDGELLIELPHDKGIADTDARVFLGSCCPNAGFPGALDELALFNVALSEDEIQDIMDNGLEEATGVLGAVSPADKLATTWGQIKYE